jgi:hypothetical protein
VSPDDPRHGTTAGYSAGCRLGCCREARNYDERMRRKHRDVLGIRRSVPAIGTQRRIQALMVLGWTSRDIAGRCGWATPQAVTELLTARRFLQRDTASAVAAAYDELSMLPGPSRQNRRRCQRKGWAPPLAWDNIDDPDEVPTFGGSDDQVDPVVVDRLLDGRRVPSTRAEKLEAMRRWRASGRSEKSLCDTHGWKYGRYVTREAGAA